MLTLICEHLHNWFDEGCEKTFGEFTVGDGDTTVPDCGIKPGQYYRIIGSVYNDGVHESGRDELTAETFDGAVWLMKVPKQVVQLAEEMAAWQEKNGAADSAAMSPFNSESFAGYSYTKQNTAEDGTSGVFAAYKARLSLWRKI